MPILAKLLGMWAVGKTVSSATPLMIQLIRGVAAIAICGVLVAMLVTLLIVGGTWLGYEQLIALGYSAPQAIFCLGATLLVLLVVTIIILTRYIARAIRTTKQLVYVQSPLSSKAAHVVESFWEGFKHK